MKAGSEGLVYIMMMIEELARKDTKGFAISSETFKLLFDTF